MKKILLMIVMVAVSTALFAYTKDEVMELPYKQTEFYGGTFSRELFDKVRILEGNSGDFIASYDNCYSYKNH